MLKYCLEVDLLLSGENDLAAALCVTQTVTRMCDDLMCHMQSELPVTLLPPANRWRHRIFVSCSVWRLGDEVVSIHLYWKKKHTAEFVNGAQINLSIDLRIIGLYFDRLIGFSSRNILWFQLFRCSFVSCDSKLTIFGFWIAGRTGKKRHLKVTSWARLEFFPLYLQTNRLIERIIGRFIYI